MAARLEMALGDMVSGSSAWPAAHNKPRSSAAFWEEEVVQLMLGRRPPIDVFSPSAHSSTSAHALPWNASAASTTLDLLGAASSARPPPHPHLSPLAPVEDPGRSASCCFDLDADSPLPSGWEKCLDLQTGNIYYLNRSTGLSTSCDPRKATPNSTLNNWPTSPSSSSDLTCEANAPPSSCKPPLLSPPHDSSHLDLTLSLKPSSLNRPLNPSLNHSLTSNFTCKLGNLISSQGALHHNQAFFPSSLSSLPCNSTPRTPLPVCASSPALTTSSSSPSTALFFQESSVYKDNASVGTFMCMSKGLNGMSRYASSNSITSASMSARDKPTMKEARNLSPISHSVGVSARASKPTTSDSSSSMITVGCANCLMFVMLPKSSSPRCPRCGALIDSDLPLPPPLKKPKLGFSLID